MHQSQPCISMRHCSILPCQYFLCFCFTCDLDRTDLHSFPTRRSSDLDMDLAAKGLGAKEWNNSLKTKLSLLPKKLFRIRMSRNFGMKMLTMTNLSTECLIQLTKLGYDATPFNQILKQNAKREMR